MSLRLFPVLALALLPAAAQQPAAVKRPMTFADLQAIKRVADPQISPSGRWVMFSATDVSLEKNTRVSHLWVVPLDGSGAEKQVTTGDGESNGRFSPVGKTIALTMKNQVYTMSWDDAAGTAGKPVQVTQVNGGADGAIWSPDSRRLLFTMSVYPECSDAGGWAREYACDEAKQKAAEASGVQAQVFTHLLYRHWNAWTGERRSHVGVVDVDGRNLRDLTPRRAVGDAETPTFSLGGPLGYAWAPDSHEIAYVTNLEVGFAKPGIGLQPGESTNNDVFTLKLDQPGAKAVKVSTAAGSDDGPQYSPDGKYLAWRSQARDGYESDKFDLVVMDRSAGTIRDLTPAATFNRWVNEFTWLPGSDGIAFVSGLQGESPIAVMATDGQYVTLTQLAGEFAELNISRGGALAASRVAVDHPAGLVALKLPALHTGAVDRAALANAAAVPLGHLNDALLNGLALNPQESFWFASANGDRVQGFLVKPPNFDPAKKYPVKFLIHGGPQGAWGDAWSYRWNPELFAADGYVVVMVNPHGSEGYGQKFLEEVSGDWGGLPYSDLMRGLDYAEQHYSFIDRNRECALGASYGGYMANWVLTHTDRFKCIVTHDGMYNPQSAFGTTEELWFNEWEFRPRAGAQGPGSAARGQGPGPRVQGAKGKAKARGNVRTSKGAAENPAPSTAYGAAVEQTKPARPWDFYTASNEQDPFRKFSPMLAIRNAHTPTLVVHGQKDYRLDVSEGFQLFTALQLLGVPSKMLYFPDEGHWVLKPKNSQLWYETVNDWCDRWLGMGKYANAGPERNPAAVSGASGPGNTAAPANTAAPRPKRPAKSAAKVDR